MTKTKENPDATSSFEAQRVESPQRSLEGYVGSPDLGAKIQEAVEKMTPEDMGSSEFERKNVYSGVAQEFERTKKVLGAVAEAMQGHDGRHDESTREGRLAKRASELGSVLTGAVNEQGTVIVTDQKYNGYGPDRRANGEFFADDDPTDLITGPYLTKALVSVMSEGDPVITKTTNEDGKVTVERRGVLSNGRVIVHTAGPSSSSLRIEDPGQSDAEVPLAA